MYSLNAFGEQSVCVCVCVRVCEGEPEINGADLFVALVLLDLCVMLFLSACLSAKATVAQ